MKNCGRLPQLWKPFRTDRPTGEENRRVRSASGQAAQEQPGRPAETAGKSRASAIRHTGIPNAKHFNRADIHLLRPGVRTRNPGCRLRIRAYKKGMCLRLLRAHSRKKHTQRQKAADQLFFPCPHKINSIVSGLLRREPAAHLSWKRSRAMSMPSAFICTKGLR